MTTPQPPDPYSAATLVAGSGANASIIPGAALGATMMTLNTSVLNVASVQNSGVFGYENVPTQGSMLFSLAPKAGTDAFGNTFPAGVVINAGNINSVNMTGISMDSSSKLLGSLIQSGQIATPSITGGTATSTLHVLNQAGGAVLSYTNSGSTATFSTAGTYSWTAPTNVTSVKVECWGGGAGGGGGSGTQGGEGGGGGEYAAENSLTVVPGSVYQVQVGGGGAGGNTNNPGNSGGDSIFTDPIGNNLVYAFGGQAGLNFQGGSGGLGSGNSVEEPGGSGATASGNSGGNGGGSSGGTAAPGNSGTASTGSTGGAGGSAPSGGGGGGAGGNNAANGVNGSSPGGAGGGAGQGAGLGSQINTYYPTGSISYFGSQHNPPNYFRSVNSSVYQGTSGSTGDQYGFFLYNYHQIRSDLAGGTVNSILLHLNNLGTGQSSGMTVAIGYTTFTGTFGTTFIPGGGTHEAQSTFHVPQNSSATYDITSWLASHITSDFTAIIIGPAASFTSPGNAGAYGLFFGYSASNLSSTPYLKINFTPPGSTTQTAGSGSAGQVKITYNGSNTLVGAFSPNSGTDVFGNAYNPGSTTVQHTFLSIGSNPGTPGAGVVIASSSPSSGQLQTTTSTGVSSTVSVAQSGGGGQSVNSATTVAACDGFSVASGDVITGTVLRISAWGSGNTSSSGTLTALTLNIQGGNAVVTIPTAQQLANIQVIWTAVAYLRFTAASTANIHLEFSFSNASGSVHGHGEGDSTGVAISFPYTYQMFGHWGSAQTSQVLTCNGTLFERLSN